MFLSVRPIGKQILLLLGSRLSLFSSRYSVSHLASCHSFVIYYYAREGIARRNSDESCNILGIWDIEQAGRCASIFYKQSWTWTKRVFVIKTDLDLMNHRKSFFRSAEKKKKLMRRDWDLKKTWINRSDIIIVTKHVRALPRGVETIH